MKEAFGLVQRGIYIFRVENGKLTSAVGVEDNLSRMRQLGMQPIRNES